MVSFIDEHRVNHVVASDAEAVPEILANTASLMVSSDDPIALHKAVLETLHRSSSEAAKAEKSGRMRAEEFRIERRIDSMIRLFEDIFSGRF